MLNVNTLWVLASAEMRSCRRLARTWVFIAVAVLFCTGWYIGMTAETLSLAPPSGWINDHMNPRYTISTMMNAFVAIFSFGIIFLMFDIRARDVQNRIRDVVDSLPATNVEIVLGRLFGILLLLLIPCLVFLAVVAGYELITYLIGFRFRIGIQPISVVSLVVWNLIPNLLFYGTLVACLSVLVRIRLLVAMIALGVLIGSLWVENQIPLRFQESFAQFLGSTVFPSDLAPVFVTSTIVGSKCAFLFVSIALLLFAASLLPRTEPRRLLNATLGITACGIATLTFFGLILHVHGKESQKEEWVSLHRQQLPVSFPDVQHLQGTIDLRPGREISIDVVLSVSTPVGNSTDSVVFSLNPGYKIKKLSIDGKETTEFSFDAGLLKIPSQLLPEVSHDIRVLAKGHPNDQFAYLDQARDFQRITHHSVPRLGLRNSIYHRDFVALMPGIVWYPISGAAIDRDQLETRPRDLFTTNLKVVLPKKWQVAIVGKRSVIENQTRQTVQFMNNTHVPELALLASRFEHRTANIDSIGFEVLFSKKHRHNLDVVAPITDQIQEWIAERIRTARSLSLDYPFDVFYVVEVPSNLRIYGGGWRMDTVLQPPGMMLVRETAFPTAPFETEFRRASRRDSESEEKQHTRVFTALLRYFANDAQGGNPFAGVARNFVSHQVSATKRGATALQYLLDQLSNQLVTQQESSSIISASDFDTRPPGLLFGQTPEYHTSFNVATQSRMDIASLPSTWEFMDRFALFDLDFNATPIPSYRVLLTKAHALAKSMITHYGTEKIGKFLALLLTNYRGQTFNVENLTSVASSVGIDLQEWVLPWLETTELPGFFVVAPSVWELEDPELGEAEFQTTLILHNAESTPGFVRVVWSEGDERETLYRWAFGDFAHSDPIFIRENHSKRIAIQSATPLTGIWIEPFLALNRAPIEVTVPEYNADTTQASPKLPFVSDIEWQPTDTDAIVVDDLDPGFSIVSRTAVYEEYSLTQNDQQSIDLSREYDQGLPIASYPVAGEWLRLMSSGSYGFYRRTHTKVAHGDEMSAAKFSAVLPSIGSWSLELFIPRTAFEDQRIRYYIDGIGLASEERTFVNRRADPNAPEEHYRLEIRDGNSVWTEQFNIANAQEGWNDVGQFEVDSTEVEVILSDWAGNDEIMVHADAIRWTPVKTE